MPLIFHALDRDALHLVHVDQALLFFLNEVFEGLADLHLPLLGALAEDVGQHVFHVDVHLFDALVGDDLEGGKGLLADVEFHHALVELAFAQLLAQFLAGAGAGSPASSGSLPRLNPMLPSCGRARRDLRRHRRQQQVEQTLFGVQFGFVGNILELLLANHVDGDFDQVADHRFHIASHVAHLGELRGFDLQERRVGQLGQAAGDLGLAHAGRAHHDDVLGNDFFRQLGRQLLPPHAIAQGDRDGAFGLVLADHVLVEFAHDLARRQLIQCDILFINGCG